jgi:membrane protease YdiL (CAAX protease family)
MQEGPRFCKRCGQRIDGGACPACSRGPPRRARPTQQQGTSPVGSALGLYFALLATFIFMVVSEGPATELFVGGVDAVIVLVWVGMWQRRIRPILSPPANPAWWVWAPALALCTFALAVLWVSFANSSFGVGEESYSEAYLAEGFGWPWIILSICVQPALVEEFAFRGVIMQALRHVMSEREVLVVSAFMFTVLHVNVLSFPSLLMIGLVLGWVRLRSRSIWPCVLLHFCHNGLVLLDEAVGLT